MRLLCESAIKISPGKIELAAVAPHGTKDLDWGDWRWLVLGDAGAFAECLDDAVDGLKPHAERAKDTATVNTTRKNGRCTLCQNPFLRIS